MGCTIRVTRRGYLAYRLRSKSIPGYQSQERTGLKDSPKNRAKLAARARVISDEIRAGTFDYLRWFPHGNIADRTRPRAPSPLTIGEYAEQVWLPRNQPPLVREWCAWDYKKHLRKHILPAFQDVPFSEVTPAALEVFRRNLLTKNLALKTVRNIIDATFRALYRDARTDGFTQSDPFAALTWPRRPRQAPDPFTEEERDLILDHFARKRRHYNPFVLLLFWTGLRISEAIGLRWGDIDLRTSKIMIRRSRTLHEDNAPKTAHSERTIDVAPGAVRALREIKPLHVTDEDFVFKNLQGRPIFPDAFVKKFWHPALRALNLRPRKFYATRHTFISAALGRGVRIKWLAEYCGTSVDMIERHYGRYVRGDAAAQLALLEGRGDEVGQVKANGDPVPILGARPGKSRAVSGSRGRGKNAKKR